jgi:hypothetical protein
MISRGGGGPNRTMSIAFAASCCNVRLLCYLLQGAWAVYSQLAAMKVLPQITTGARRNS